LRYQTIDYIIRVNESKTCNSQQRSFEQYDVINYRIFLAKEIVVEVNTRT